MLKNRGRKHTESPRQNSNGGNPGVMEKHKIRGGLGVGWQRVKMTPGKSLPKTASVRKQRQAAQCSQQAGMSLCQVTWPHVKTHLTILRTVQALKHKESHRLVVLSPGLGPSKISFITIHGSSNMGITVGLYTVSPVREEQSEFYPGDKQLFKFSYLTSYA